MSGNSRTLTAGSFDRSPELWGLTGFGSSARAYRDRYQFLGRKEMHLDRRIRFYGRDQHYRAWKICEEIAGSFADKAPPEFKFPMNHHRISRIRMGCPKDNELLLDFQPLCIAKFCPALKSTACTHSSRGLWVKWGCFARQLRHRFARSAFREKAEFDRGV